MMKSLIPARWIARIEEWTGRGPSTRELSSIERELPESELDLLKRLVAIDTQTLNRTGVERAQEIVSGILRELGFRLEFTSKDPRFAHLIVAERPGKRREFISFATHTDTVLGNDRAAEFEVARATGSGVIDNKGGVVVGLSALRRFLRDHPATEFGLRFICSPNEEMGSIGFVDIFRELGRDTRFGFGLEPALDDGSIVDQRRGNRWYDVTIDGHEAHAGRSYGDHANAAHDLANKIQRLARLTNHRKQISVNVGHVEAGKDRHNIVCGFAKMKLDTRFPSVSTRDRLHRKIMKILEAPSHKGTCGRRPTKTRFQVVDDCPPFLLSPSGRRVAKSYAALVSRIENRVVRSRAAGGAGDVNYLSTGRNFILDGLGPVGGHMHTEAEFLQVNSLVTRSQALAAFLVHIQSLG